MSLNVIKTSATVRYLKKKEIQIQDLLLHDLVQYLSNRLKLTTSNNFLLLLLLKVQIRSICPTCTFRNHGDQYVVPTKTGYLLHCARTLILNPTIYTSYADKCNG